MERTCEYQDCKEPAVYFIGWQEADGHVRFGLVCETHDQEVGRKNLMDLAAMTRQEATRWERAYASR